MKDLNYNLETQDSKTNFINIRDNFRIIADEINKRPLGGYYILNNATVTVINEQSVPVKIEGESLPIPINSYFDHKNNRVTYTLDVEKSFIVSAVCTVIGNNNKNVSLYLALNGAAMPETEMHATTDGNGKVENIKVQGLFELNKDDYLEVWIANNSDDTDFTVIHLNFIAKGY